MSCRNSRHRRTRRFKSSFFLVALASAAVFPAASARAAAIHADEVSAYTPGNANASFQTASAALGPIIGDTTFGGLNPFNPPFSSSHIVIVGEGGSLTLRLASPIPVTGPSTMLGVFVNNGLVDVSGDGSGQAGSPPTTFSLLPRAVVSVATTPLGPFVALNGGSAITFDNPTNAYLDTTISNFNQPLGTQLADQSKPFIGHLSDFAGKTYPQLRTTLNGSAGGTWLDLSGTALPAVQYVKFDVPAGAGYRMVVDSVAAVPEPGAGAAILVIGSFAISRRRRVVG